MRKARKRVLAFLLMFSLLLPDFGAVVGATLAGEAEVLFTSQELTEKVEAPQAEEDTPLVEGPAPELGRDETTPLSDGEVTEKDGVEEAETATVTEVEVSEGLEEENQGEVQGETLEETNVAPKVDVEDLGVNVQGDRLSEEA